MLLLLLIMDWLKALLKRAEKKVLHYLLYCLHSFAILSADE
jgi:hypothetical protein